jgi:hypothetical protein
MGSAERYFFDESPEIDFHKVVNIHGSHSLCGCVCVWGRRWRTCRQTSEVESSRDERLDSWRCGHGQLRVHAVLLHARYQAPGRAGPQSWSLRLLPAFSAPGRGISVLEN